MLTIDINYRCLTLFNPPNTHGHIIWIIYVLTARRRLGLRLKAGLVWITGHRMRQDSHSLSTLICRQRWRERQEEKRRRKRWGKRWERRFLGRPCREICCVWGGRSQTWGPSKGRWPKVCWEYITWSKCSHKWKMSHNSMGQLRYFSPEWNVPLDIRRCRSCLVTALWSSQVTTVTSSSPDELWWKKVSSQRDPIHCTFDFPLPRQTWWEISYKWRFQWP